MKAIMNTRSNYKNCNGIKLNVQECRGTRISCYIPYDGFDKIGNPINGKNMIIADFTIKEVSELYD